MITSHSKNKSAPASKGRAGKSFTRTGQKQTVEKPPHTPHHLEKKWTHSHGMLYSRNENTFTAIELSQLRPLHKKIHKLALSIHDKSPTHIHDRQLDLLLTAIASMALEAEDPETDLAIAHHFLSLSGEKEGHTIETLKASYKHLISDLEAVEKKLFADS